MNPFPIIPYQWPNPNPPGITFPFEIGQDMLGIVDGITPVTVTQTNPDTMTAVQTATNVAALKKITGVQTQAIGDGEIGYVNLSRIRIWASTCPFVPKYRDTILDAEGVTWMVGQKVTIEGFNSFYVCDECTQVKTQ